MITNAEQAAVDMARELTEEDGKTRFVELSTGFRAIVAKGRPLLTVPPLKRPEAPEPA